MIFSKYLRILSYIVCLGLVVLFTSVKHLRFCFGTLVEFFSGIVRTFFLVELRTGEYTWQEVGGSELRCSSVRNFDKVEASCCVKGSDVIFSLMVQCLTENGCRVLG